MAADSPASRLLGHTLNPKMPAVQRFAGNVMQTKSAEKCAV
jgi:hypothetical protein